MTPPLEVQIDDVIIHNRIRIEYHNKDGLKESLEQNGTMQPLVLVPTADGRMRLLAGGRRITFLKELGHKTLYHSSSCDPKRPGFVLGNEIPEDTLHELELEENLKRSEMTWQERCLGIALQHELKQKRAAIEGNQWGMRETAALLGINGHSNVQYAIIIANHLKKELDATGKPSASARFWKCETLTDAWRLELRDREDAALAELALRSASGVAAIAPTIGLEGLLSDAPNFVPPDESKPLISNPSAKEDARQRYLSNPLNDPLAFDTYYESYLALCSKKELHQNSIPLSSMLFNTDCIDFMLLPSNKERFDHCITDPPYGIDMDMLNQQNPQGSMVDIDTVEAEHTIEGNIDLFKRLFPAVYQCLKPNAYFVLWCDQMQWQLLYDLAIASSFKVQRWPITWVKTHRCMNQCAQFNFTKTTEIAMVCRKGQPTLMMPAGECHIIAPHDDYKTQLGHPFVKPYVVWDYIIQHVSMQNQLILEPFAGRGSGFISMLRANRKVVGCELNPAHYNALLENVKQYYLRINPNFQFA